MMRDFVICNGINKKIQGLLMKKCDYKVDFSDEGEKMSG